jgi:hypothetical protein
MVHGDPLDLKPVIAQMAEQGVLNPQGYASSESWFKYTAEHEYPDAINALYTGVTNHVTNRANLIVSFNDGFHYGSQFFDKLVTMRSTHGNLHRTSMTGFYMQNAPLPRPIMPARELLKE